MVEAAEAGLQLPTGRAVVEVVAEDRRTMRSGAGEVVQRVRVVRCWVVRAEGAVGRRRNFPRARSGSVSPVVGAGAVCYL